MKLKLFSPKKIAILAGVLVLALSIVHIEGDAHPYSGYFSIQPTSTGSQEEPPVAQINDDGSLVRIIWGNRIHGTLKFKTGSIHVAEFNTLNRKIAYSAPSNVDAEARGWRSFSTKVSLVDEAGLAKKYIALPFPTLWLSGQDISNPQLSIRLGKMGIVRTYFHNQVISRHLAWQVVIGDISRPEQICDQILIDPYGHIGLLVSANFKRVCLFDLTLER